MASETDKELTSKLTQFDESDEPNHRDFEEIRHCGGTLTISATGGIKFTHSSPYPASINILCISLNGYYHGLVQPWGFGGPVPDIPFGSTFVYLFSDIHSLFGRRCPRCKKYFRASALSDKMFCVYCNFIGNSGSFLTDNQKTFIQAYLAACTDAIIGENEIEIDIDKIIEELPDNKKSPFAYSEQRQQAVYSCSSCDVRYDILGEYGRCPFCGYINSFEVFGRSLSTLNARIQNPLFTKEERQEREEEWIQIQGRCFSIFESYCDDLRKRLLYLPTTSRRRKKLTGQSFQRIIEANQTLKEVLDIDYLIGMPESDVNFLTTSVNQRHIFAHRNGIVDEDYIANTDDSSVKLGEKLRLRRKDVKRLAELLEKAAHNFLVGLQSIQKSTKQIQNSGGT